MKSHRNNRASDDNRTAPLEEILGRSQTDLFEIESAKKQIKQYHETIQVIDERIIDIITSNPDFSKDDLEKEMEEIENTLQDGCSKWFTKLSFESTQSRNKRNRTNKKKSESLILRLVLVSRGPSVRIAPYRPICIKLRERFRVMRTGPYGPPSARTVSQPSTWRVRAAEVSARTAACAPLPLVCSERFSIARSARVTAVQSGDDEILKLLKDKKYDEDVSFCEMIIPMLKKLSTEQKHYAKIEILNALNRANKYSPEKFMSPRATSTLSQYRPSSYHPNTPPCPNTIRQTPSLQILSRNITVISQFQPDLSPQTEYTPSRNQTIIPQSQLDPSQTQYTLSHNLNFPNTSFSHSSYVVEWSAIDMKDYVLLK
ncbi:hypothetical protein K1T71_011819 [Dendrolimus kikuchii]|uniref:Uncharacterized protein n=1 Tax=Dendrolimus kikuchii TaxID=765133 RepID=A0ACC1CM83_9NEOP|nr:hypothetical protein K1T71_011819 [Dendrolimus kikuchii]